jgi:transcriptional regulator with XRE-family HTH domain
MDEQLARQIGRAARAARSALGWTQAAVADRLELSPEFYGRLERGTAMPSVETLRRLAAELRVSVDELLGLRKAPAKPVPRAERKLDQVLERRLHRASPGALRLVRVLLGEFERAEGRSRRVHRPER